MKKKILFIGAGALAASVIGIIIAKVIGNHHVKYTNACNCCYSEEDDSDVRIYEFKKKGAQL